MIEGTVDSIPPQGREHPQQEFIKLIPQILFICGGAFSGLEKNCTNNVKRKAVLIHG